MDTDDRYASTDRDHDRTLEHSPLAREERLLAAAKAGAETRNPDRAPIAAAYDEVRREAEILENLVASLVDRLSPVLDLTPYPAPDEVAAEIASGVEFADALRRHVRHLDEISDRLRYALDRLAL